MSPTFHTLTISLTFTVIHHLTQSLIYSPCRPPFIHSPSHLQSQSFTISLSHSFTHHVALLSYTHHLTYTHSHSPSHSVTHCRAHSLAISATHHRSRSPSHSPFHSLTISLTHLLNISLSVSFIRQLPKVVYCGRRSDEPICLEPRAQRFSL